MKFTLNWLNEFIAVKTTPEKLAELLTMAGLEVESLTRLTEPETNREDWLLEIAVTPNRADCLGLRGIAREVAALTGGTVKAVKAGAPIKRPAAVKGVSVTIEDPRLCPRYSARILEAIKIGSSPAWLRFRLEACGIRAINNVVDITNYVMLETGQPLHAFDLDLLPGRRIVVRPAAKAMKFTTLDGAQRELVAEDLLICAGDDPVALAGVMGGMDSEVRESTKSILLESANFDGTAIRRTAKRLGLHSEASHRFERGVDADGTLAALDRAGLTLDDIDLIELNEAFASQTLAVIRELGLDLDKLNVNGGAIALGHPMGATGTKLTVQLLAELARRKARYGMVTMCVGGGQGAAGIFENLQS